jgi:hypothetical protein
VDFRISDVGCRVWVRAGPDPRQRRPVGCTVSRRGRPNDERWGRRPGGPRARAISPPSSRPGPTQEPVAGRGRRRRRLPAYSGTNDERASGVTAAIRRGRPTSSELGRHRRGEGRPAPTPNCDVRAQPGCAVFGRSSPPVFLGSGTSRARPARANAA